jgi:hypothetical protein
VRPGEQGIFDRKARWQWKASWLMLGYSEAQIEALKNDRVLV